MEILFQRWVESRSATRLLCWCVVSGVVVLAVWGLLVRPAMLQSAELMALSNSAARTNAALWPDARQQPWVEVREIAPGQPFSPLDFQGEGATLVSWKPQQNGGELVLSASWPEIPNLLSRLTQRDVRVTAFDIIPQGAQLRLSLQLENDHAQ